MAELVVEPEIILHGIPASPGIAIGPLHVMARGFSAPEVYEIAPEDVPHEQERFREALEVTKIYSWRSRPFGAVHQGR